MAHLAQKPVSLGGLLALLICGHVILSKWAVFLEGDLFPIGQPKEPWPMTGGLQLAVINMFLGPVAGFATREHGIGQVPYVMTFLNSVLTGTAIWSVVLLVRLARQRPSSMQATDGTN